MGFLTLQLIANPTVFGTIAQTGGLVILAVTSILIWLGCVRGASPAPHPGDTVHRGLQQTQSPDQRPPREHWTGPLGAAVETRVQSKVLRRSAIRAWRPHDHSRAATPARVRDHRWGPFMTPNPHDDNIFECDIEARPLRTIAVQQMWKRVLRGFEPLGGQIALVSSGLIRSHQVSSGLIGSHRPPRARRAVMLSARRNVKAFRAFDGSLTVPSWSACSTLSKVRSSRRKPSTCCSRTPISTRVPSSSASRYSGRVTRATEGIFRS